MERVGAAIQEIETLGKGGKEGMGMKGGMEMRYEEERGRVDLEDETRTVRT